MNQYTLLLVDDEEEVIQVIMHKIPWEELGFSVIGHANNGIKALEIMEENQPDVVMTDIRMPYMDGMELCSNIRQKYPTTHVLLYGSGMFIDLIQIILNCITNIFRCSQTYHLKNLRQFRFTVGH